MASGDFDLAEEIGRHGDWQAAVGVIHDDHEYSLVREGDSVERIGDPNLPIYPHLDQITETVEYNPVTFLEAEMGVGKSTQVPPALWQTGLYDRVVICQPRRIAAEGVATYMRAMVSVVYGEQGARDIVSFQTAGELDGLRDAPISVETDGLRLVKEFHQTGVTGRDVLIIDEAHEANSNMVMLMAWVKGVLRERPDMRLLIMSGYMDSAQLADYYEEVLDRRPPILRIPGRNYHVEMVENPKSRVVDSVLRIISKIPDEEGELPPESTGILVFLPGKRQIRDVAEEIFKKLPERIKDDVVVVPLHAKLSKEEQDKALCRYEGKIKVVLATNIAQTSVTIEDIRYVVDGGTSRLKDIDSEGTPRLLLAPVSLADIKQRAGRTGRVADGYYELVAMDKHTPFTSIKDRPRFLPSEISRTEISRNMLRLKALGIEVADFNLPLDEVADHTIDLADHTLRLLGAIDDQGKITRIGLEMEHYPLSTPSARIMVEAHRYKEDTKACLAAIVAAVEAGGLKYTGYGSGQRWKELTGESSSDLLAQLDLFIAAQNMTPREMKEYDLDIDNIKRARETYYKVTRLAGVAETVLEKPSDLTREDIKDCVCVGYVNSIYRHVGEGKYVQAVRQLPTPRTLSKTSVVSTIGGAPDWVLGAPYAIEPSDGSEIKHFIENVTVVTRARLGRIAAGSVVQLSEGYLMRTDEGTFVEQLRHKLFGIDLGVVEERTPEPSPALRHAIIEHVLSNPGSAQKELRGIKKELEHLSRIAKDHVPKLTHDQILALINEAAPADVTHPAEVEDNLRAMLHDPERKLSLDDFVPPHRREQIVADAPEVIEVAGGRIQLKYQKGGPIASHFSDAHIMSLDDDVLLPDGRPVMFSYPGDKKKYTLHEIQEKIRSESGLA